MSDDSSIFPGGGDTVVPKASRVTLEDLERMARAFQDLLDPVVMAGAWDEPVEHGPSS